MAVLGARLLADLLAVDGDAHLALAFVVAVARVAEVFLRATATATLEARALVGVVLIGEALVPGRARTGRVGVAVLAAHRLGPGQRLTEQRLVAVVVGVAVVAELLATLLHRRAGAAACTAAARDLAGVVFTLAALRDDLGAVVVGRAFHAASGWVQVAEAVEIVFLRRARLHVVVGLGRHRLGVGVVGVQVVLQAKEVADFMDEHVLDVGRVRLAGHAPGVEVAVHRDVGFGDRARLRPGREKIGRRHAEDPLAVGPLAILDPGHLVLAVGVVANRGQLLVGTGAVIDQLQRRAGRLPCGERRLGFGEARAGVQIGGTGRMQPKRHRRLGPANDLACVLVRHRYRRGIRVRRRKHGHARDGEQRGEGCDDGSSSGGRQESARL